MYIHFLRSVNIDTNDTYIIKIYFNIYKIFTFICKQFDMSIIKFLHFLSRKYLYLKYFVRIL